MGATNAIPKRSKIERYLLYVAVGELWWIFGRWGHDSHTHPDAYSHADTYAHANTYAHADGHRASRIYLWKSLRLLYLHFPKSGCE